MIVTLAANAVARGLMILCAGGLSPRDFASPEMRRLAADFAIPGLPNPAACWAVIGAATVFALKRTAFGRAIYGVGGRERVADLSGCASKAAQAIGDAYLLPAIAAVALGGISILGGRGGDLDAVAGAMPITPSQSILWATQIAKVGRRFVDGVVIVCMSAL